MVDKEQFETVNEGLLVRAPAKLNLSLLIAGKQPDGFHEIETIMAKINFYDELLIRQGVKTGIELICEGPNWAPQGQDNLAWQAAELLLDTFGISDNIKITLTKNVPAGSGLGSASSDAAATLAGLNRYLDLQLPNQQLAELAVRLGADAPFFLAGPLAFCSGIGEKIKKIDKIFDFSALLILPDVSVSTKKVYDNYSHDPNLYKKLETEINRLIEKNRIDLVSQMCANMLESICFGLHREIAELKEKIELLGIKPLCLSGSGSAMFHIAKSTKAKKLREFQHKLDEKFGCKSIIVSNNRW